MPVPPKTDNISYVLVFLPSVNVLNQQTFDFDHSKNGYKKKENQRNQTRKPVENKSIIVPFAEPTPGMMSTSLTTRSSTLNGYHCYRKKKGTQGYQNKEARWTKPAVVVPSGILTPGFTSTSSICFLFFSTFLLFHARRV